MIVEYLKFVVPDPAGERFRNVYPQAGAVLAANSHCLDWELRRSVEHPDEHIVRVAWDSSAGHVSFRDTLGFRELMRLLTEFASCRVEMAHYALVAERETS